VPCYFFDWNAGREEYVLQHGVTAAEFEEVVMNPLRVDVSRTSSHHIAFGETSTGKQLACVYEEFDDTVYPVTAFEFNS